MQANRIDRRAFLGLLAAVASSHSRADSLQHRGVPIPFAGRVPAPGTVQSGIVEISSLLDGASTEGKVYLAPAGSDSADGTSDDPCLSLREAFIRPEPVVVLAPGTYAPATLRGKRKRLIAPDGGVTIREPGPDLSDQYFVPNEDRRIWTAYLDLPEGVRPHRVLQRNAFDRYGFERRLLRRRGEDFVVSANRPSWSYSANDGYLTFAFQGPLARFDASQYRCLYTDNRGNSGLINEGGSLAVIGDIVLDGVAVEARPFDAAPPRIALRGCVIQHSLTNGLRMESGQAVSESVRVFAARYDGFNYSAAPDMAQGLAVEINCRITSSGDLAAFGRPAFSNCNASSAHGTFDIARFGGIYERSYGADIADTAEVDHDSYSWNVGVIARESLVNIGFGFYGESALRRAWLDTCSSEFSDTVVQAAEINTYNSKLGRIRTLGGAHLQFDPFWH